MTRVLLVLLLMLLTIPAWAAPRRCNVRCKPKACQCAPRVVATPAPSLWDQACKGLVLNAGFRWQTEEECPPPVLCTETPRRTEPPSRVHDPFYVGAGLRLPLAKQTAIYGGFDRDFTDRAEWQARVQVEFSPFNGR